MSRKPRIHIPLVDHPCALGLGKDEIAEESKAEERVEGEPGEEGEKGFEEGEEGEDDEVHEPWDELGRVGGAQGFVGGEDRERDGYEGATSRKLALQL